MNELTDFLEVADETTTEWIGLLRVETEMPEDGQIGALVGIGRDWEHKGAVLVAMASGANDMSHVAISVHAFVDGKRVEPTVATLGDEVLVTLQNLVEGTNTCQ